MAGALGLTAECGRCGGTLLFEPAAQALRCVHCKQPTPIVPVGGEVVPLPYADFADADAAHTVEVLTHTCAQCGAATTLAPQATTGRCPFCKRPFVAEAVSTRLIRPSGLLPLLIAQDAAVTGFKGWLGKRRFAPNDLSPAAVAGAFTPVYLPAWSFASDTWSDYDGRRGDWYYTTETYTERVGEETVTKTRQVRHTSWSDAAGRVSRSFGDLLVPASHTITGDQDAALQPWDLSGVQPYQDEYLLGSMAESYGISLPSGWAAAQAMMAPVIEGDVKADIGGDEQQVEDVRTTYATAAFVHLLLPIWIAAYTYRATTYRILVNGRTGEVWGQRPYSKIMIALTVLAAVLVVAALITAYSLTR